jgi:aminoglycoside 3-N-acetyltransferase
VRTYDLGDVANALHACGIRSGDVIFVHSSLFTLGRLMHVEPPSVPGRLVEFFLDYLGPSGTLGVPTFNFDFCSGQPYNPETTPSERMGAFNEAVRLHPFSCRSPHPLQSTAYIGARAAGLTAGDPPSGYGTDSRLPRCWTLMRNSSCWAAGLLPHRSCITSKSRHRCLIGAGKSLLALTLVTA